MRVGIESQTKKKLRYKFGSVYHQILSNTHISSSARVHTLEQLLNVVSILANTCNRLPHEAAY